MIIRIVCCAHDTTHTTRHAHDTTPRHDTHDTTCTRHDTTVDYSNNQVFSYFPWKLVGVKKLKGCSLTFSSMLIYELLWFCYPIIMRTFFWEKGVIFSEKKINFLILISIIKKNLRIMLGKRNDRSLKKYKKYKTLKLTQKVDYSVKNTGDFLWKCPPFRFTILI